MKHPPLSLGPFLLLLAVAAPRAWGAATTGELSGVVTTETGAPVADAAIVAESPAQIGGALPATTNAQGRFRYARVAPGVYTLRVGAEGYASRVLTEVE